MSFTFGGVVFMTAAWVIILALCAYCMFKVLCNRKSGDQPEE